MISRHKIQQNTARNDRTVLNVAVCRTFMRSVFFVTTTHRDGYIDRSL
jgi:hypothetical protein